MCGTAIATWLWGGFAVGDPTLNRFFSLHYLLPFVIAGVVVLHIWALHVPGNNNPLGIDVKGPQDTRALPSVLHGEGRASIVGLFVILYRGLRVLRAELLGNPDNYMPANPLVTPPDIVPEWYLLPFYAMLRSVPQKLIGVIVLVGALRHAGLHAVAGHLARALDALPPADEAVLLGLRRRLPAARLLRRAAAPMPCSSAPAFRWCWVARLGTLYYFAYFWLILPLLGLIETPQAAARHHRATPCSAAVSSRSTRSPSERSRCASPRLALTSACCSRPAARAPPSTPARCRPRSPSWSFDGPFGTV